MKILIAYDGSRCADAALDDLVRAGLPNSVEALIISVAEVWLPPQNGNGNGNVSGIKFDPQTEEKIRRHYEKDKKVLSEASTYANHAKRRLQAMFAEWKISAEATYGSPAWEILARADEFGPELIVVGAHGQSAISRFFLGSISQKVLTEAFCSVRIARGRIETDPGPLRLMVGFDGSKGARATIDAIAARTWPADTEVRMIAATENISPSAIGRFIPPIAHIVAEVNESETEWLEKLAENELRDLRSVGLNAELVVRPGNPKKVLIEEAENWNADCIFVGANAFGSRIERFLLGSTSAAVAARAHCSVEAIRKKGKKQTA